MPRSRKTRKRDRKRLRRDYSADDNCHRCQLTSALIHDHWKPRCLLQVCDACREVTELNKKIEVAHDQLASLIQQRQAVKTRVNLKHDLLTTRLPIEIVSEIFFFVAKTMPSYNLDLYPLTNRLFPPVHLGIISKQWRTITLGLPQLWSVLRINDSDCNRNYIDLVEGSLRRSAPGPLYLTHNNFSSDGYSKHRNRLKKYLGMCLQNVLRSHAIRWHSFAYTGGWNEFFQLLHNQDCSFEQLNTLSIKLPGGQELELWEPIHLKEPLSPKNLSISTYNTYNSFGRFLGGVPLAVSQLPLKWINIMHLEIADIHLDDFLLIISQASCLVSCVIKILQPPIKEESYSLGPTGFIVHPSLTAINLYGQNQRVLSYLTLPLLHTLRCVYIQKEILEILDIDILVDFLDRSQAALDIFSFKYTVDRRTISNFSWLERLPTITHLHLDITPFYNHYQNSIEFMTVVVDLIHVLAEPTGPPTVPRLQELHIECQYGTITNWTVIYNFLRVHIDCAKQAIEYARRDAALGLPCVTGQTYYDSYGVRPINLISIQQNEDFEMNWFRHWMTGVDISAMLWEAWRSGIRFEVLNEYGDNLIARALQLLLYHQLPFSVCSEYMDSDYILD